MTEQVAVEVTVSGRVQGVAFRASTRAEALRLGVSGWVRNLPDGQVEAHFEGAAPSVAALVEWCGTGPGWARVDGIVPRPATASDLAGFEIR